MKETWPSDVVFTAPAVTDDTSDNSSLSSDEDSTCHVANLLGYLQHIFLGEQLKVSFDVVLLQGMLTRPPSIDVGTHVTRPASKVDHFT